MGLSPEDWRRALAISGAQPQTLNLFDDLDGDQLERMRREALAAQVERDEMQRALAATQRGYSAYGGTEPGTLDLSRRPYVKNDDGSTSTVRSMGVNIDGKEVLIPTVSPDGRIMSDDEAVEHYLRSGQHMGVYPNAEASSAAGEAIHQDQMRTPPVPWRDGLPENPYGEEPDDGVVDMEPITVRARPQAEIEPPASPPLQNQDPVNAKRAAIAAKFQREYPSNENLGAMGGTGNGLDRPADVVRRPVPPELLQAVARSKAEGTLADLPAGTNDALARTGSDYRVPEPERAPPPDQLAQMRDEARFATEVPIAKAESFQRQADLKGQEAARQREVTEQSRQNVDQRRQQMRGFEAQAVDRLNRITALVDSPPQESRNAGRAIMGAILSVASQGRVSDGREAMAREMRANVERWKTEIAGNREAMDALLAMSKHQGNVAEFDAQLDQKLLEYEFGALNASLEQEKLQAQSREQLHAAEQAQRTLIGGYVRSQLYTMPLPDLARAVQSGDVGEEGQKVFYERAEAETKLQKGELDLRKGQQDLQQGDVDMQGKRLGMEKTQAEIEKLRRESAGGAPGARVAGGFEIADPQVWNSIAVGTRSDFERGTSNVPGLVKQMRNLKAMVKDYGTEGTWTDAGAKMSTMSAGIMGGYKEAEKLGALDKGVVEMVERLIGDVNSMKPEWWTNVEARLDQAITQTTENNVSKAAGLGLRPMQLQEGTGQQSGGKTRGNYSQGPVPGMVMMRNRKGNIIPVRPDMVEEARRRKYEAL